MSYFTQTVPRVVLPPVLALLLPLASTLPASASEAESFPTTPVVEQATTVLAAPSAEEASTGVDPEAAAGVASAITEEPSPPTPLLPDVPALITDTAIRWNLPADRLLRIAWCESRWDPTAISYAGHVGLFQFAHPTWHVASQAVGLPHASPFDPAANTEAAAWLMSTEGFHHWGCR